MSSTNKTTNYNLSQFVGTDVPSWLGDYNGDMSKIDKAIGDVANSQGSVEQSVTGLTSEVQGLSTEVSGVSTSVQQLQTSVAQIDTAYKQADTALSQRITANANNIQANTTAIESANTAIEGINTTIGTVDISGIGDGTIKGAISGVNSSLENIKMFPDYTNIVKSGVVNNWVATEDIFFKALSCTYYEDAASVENRVKVNDEYAGVKNTANIPDTAKTLYMSVSFGYAKKGDVISCQTASFVAYGLKK